MDLNRIYEKFLSTEDVTTDSRNVPENSMFFALKGENFNGNQYAPEALNKGSKYAVIDEKKWMLDDRYILVEDVLQTLQELAHHHRKKMKAEIIAITGSNGKTTTKELIHKVLSSSFNILTNIKNYNNHIGVPLTLLNLHNEHEYGIIEMGANHPGEIEILCKITDPDYGLITNIGKAHLEGFGSFEGVKKTKGELYDYLSQNKGVIFYNEDNDILRNMLHQKDCKAINYGTNENSTCQGDLIEQNPYLTIKSNNETYQTQLIGNYNFENILAAICMGNYFGIPQHKTKKAIASYKPKNNRSQVMDTGKNRLILDAYNANPTSMQAAIKNFDQLQGDQKVLILGDMYELGKYSKEEHENLIEFLEQYSFDQVFLIGENFSSVAPEKYKSFLSTDKFLVYLKKNPLSQKNILLKGSRAMALEKASQYL